METEANEPGAQQPTNASPLDMPQQKPAEPAAAETQTADITALPDWAQTELRRARAEAAKARTTAKANAAEEAKKELAAQVAKALGIQTGDEPPDPAKLTEQVQAAQQQAYKSALQLSVYQAANKTGVDADRLLDSMSFINSLSDAVTADPGSTDFAQQIVTAVQSWTDAHPQFKTAGQAPVRSSAPITGGSGDGQPITEEDLARMTPSQIADALAAGRLKHLL